MEMAALQAKFNISSNVGWMLAVFVVFLVLFLIMRKARKR